MVCELCSPRFAWWSVLSGACLISCGADTAPPDATELPDAAREELERLGAETLENRTSDCDGIAGFNAQVIFDRVYESSESAFSWLDPTSAEVSSTTTVRVAVAVAEGGEIMCIPGRVHADGTEQLPMLSYDAVTMEMRTDDGWLNESTPAIAWLTFNGDISQNVVAERRLGELAGTFAPPGHEPEDSTVLLVAHPGPDDPSGRVSVTSTELGVSTRVGKFARGVVYGLYPALER